MKKYTLTILTFLIYILQINAQNSIMSEEYPVPEKTKKMLFYIQRNHNANTVIYDVNFNENGLIDEKKPIEVYWLRYDEDGRKRDLTTIEKQFAYGVKCIKMEDNEDTFIVKLVAYNDRQFILMQNKPHEAVIYMNIDNKLSVLDHLYIYADNSKFWPEVIYVELFGVDVKSGEHTYEKIKT